ncbi:competence type IV pilus minor pilin ComGD [Neobacillus jeddahensis]|uniref:competence type IV pilus minor pilin ComGD n=1 Tax=Neobacillus jeddahensis TaxID=1461580 RepID=UPI00058F309C|nr:competence type IV pilus minor pilin ComGD [Neobacillus jeddahensis]
MLTQQKGFTLIESLLVLSIFMIISSITAFSLQPHHSVIEDKALLSQLQADLLYAQQYAISHQHEVSVVIMPNEYKYEMILRTERPMIIERSYSKNYKFSEGSLPLYFKFLSDGNVNKFGSFFIQTKRKSYRLTFLIGKGRFYVTEQ